MADEQTKANVEEKKPKAAAAPSDTGQKPEAETQKKEKPANEKPAGGKKPAPVRARQNRRDSRYGGPRKGGPRKGRGKGRGRERKPQDEFESKIIDLARVTRVMAGGKRMRFRACVVVGDKKGRVGMGIKKGADVQLAVQKASDHARKHLITVPLDEATIPHTVETKFKGARVLMKPAKPGTGIIAGGAVRIVMDMAGIKNIVAKIKGSSNKVNNVTAVIEGLKLLRTKDDISKIKEQ